MMRTMWRNYAIAWVAYALLIVFVVQIEGLAKGHFDLLDAARNFFSILPTSLVLALIWPLSGFLEQKASATRTLLTHSLCALVFGLVWHILSYVVWQLLFGKVNFNRPLDWYIWPSLYNVMMYSVVAKTFHGVRDSEKARLQALNMSRTESLLIQAELATLRNKLNPHFLFNTLHSIIALVRKDAKAAEQALFRFSDMLRYILDTEKSGSDYVLLQDELNFVRDYLDLEALRLGSRLQIVWDIDADSLQCSVPALSIQPIVENSIKHAFNPRSQAGNLRIATELDLVAQKLRIEITDDGPGANLAQVGAATGMGVKTIERRLRLAYGDRAEFHVESSPGQGFIVRMAMPLDGHPSSTDF